jgi:hypothetical protein
MGLGTALEALMSTPWTPSQADCELETDGQVNRA